MSLKQHIPLLEYLQAHDWQPARALSRGRWMGLCPLHTDHKPSFLVDPNNSLFYCYGCGRGGDVIRFAELYHQVNFPKAIALLREWCGLAPLLNAVVDFYRIQLHRYQRSARLSGPAGNPFVRSDRAHAYRLCARRLLAKLAARSLAIHSQICNKLVWSMPLVTTAIADASSFRWTEICMAAVS